MSLTLITCAFHAVGYYIKTCSPYSSFGASSFGAGDGAGALSSLDSPMNSLMTFRVNSRSSSALLAALVAADMDTIDGCLRGATTKAEAIIGIVATNKQLNFIVDAMNNTIIRDRRLQIVALNVYISIVRLQALRQRQMRSLGIKPLSLRRKPR